MVSVRKLREAINHVFAEWEKLPYMPSDWKIVAVRDRVHDRYILQDVDMKGERYVSRTLAHVEIRDGKVWILTDNTEEGVGTGFLEQGVPKGQIVLAFYPPSVREMGEFAVA